MWKLFLSLFFFFSFSAEAYVGAVSAATGETGRAAVEASESPFGNPAALAYLNGYFFSAGYGVNSQHTKGGSQDLAVSLTDSMKDTVVPTSFSYVQDTLRPEGANEDSLGKTFKLSFGSFISQGFSFGFGVTHQEDQIPSQNFRQTNIQTGFLWAPNNNLGVALVSDNLLAAPDSVPEAYRLKQTTGLGVSYNHERFVRFKADLVSQANNAFGKPTLAAGLESYMNRWLIIRIGLQRNNEMAANLYTAGMGFTGPKFGLHYAYVNSPQNDSLNRHSVDLAVPIW